MLKEITLELTNYCDRNCIHCSSNASKQGELFLSMERIIEVLESVPKNYRKNIYINLSGGEPLAHNLILDIIHMIKEYGFKIRLYTSAYFDQASLVDEICVPSYGNYQMDSTVTRTNYNSEMLIKLYLSNNVIPTIHIVPLSCNIDGIEDNIEKLIKMGIKRIKILKLVEQGRANNSNLCPTDGQLYYLFNRYTYSEHVFFGHPFSMHLCDKGVGKKVILPDGKEIPCETYKDGECKCEPVWFITADQ